MRIPTLGILAAAAMACLSTAQAADLDDDYLRGPDYYEPVASPIIDWSGFYLGGHGGYSTAGHGFKNVFDTLTTQALGGITTAVPTSGLTLGSTYETRTSAASYGAFAGYNAQFDNLVVGVEADYTYLGQTGHVSRGVSARSTDANATLSTVVLSGNTFTKIQEYGTIRGRVGYAFDCLMPFVTGGVAVGSARSIDAVAAYPYTATFANPATAIPGAPAGYLRSKFDLVSGFTVGAGLEYALRPDIILRGEYQYVSFDKINGHYFDINSFRGGAAYKF